MCTGGRRLTFIMTSLTKITVSDGFVTPTLRLSINGKDVWEQTGDVIDVKVPFVAVSDAGPYSYRFFQATRGSSDRVGCYLHVVFSKSNKKRKTTSKPSTVYNGWFSFNDVGLCGGRK